MPINEYQRSSKVNVFLGFQNLCQLLLDNANWCNVCILGARKNVFISDDLNQQETSVH